MPPTRGHDLKLSTRMWAGKSKVDAPHTGARLETSHHATDPCSGRLDAPHTGARLETPVVS